MILLNSCLMFLLLLPVQGNVCESNACPNSSFNWKKYFKLEEIYAWLRSLSRKYPKWLFIIELPTKTYEGRPILIAKLDIPYCVCDNDRKKKAIFMESNIHAREWISSSVNSFILNELVYSKQGSVLYELARKYIWYFSILANPDGFVYTHTSNITKIRNWRKTRASTTNPQCLGSDPNRNFPFRWTPMPSKSNKTEYKLNATKSTIPNECQETFPGCKALSEPSVKAEYDFLNKIGPTLHAFFSFHSYSQVILLPYAHDDNHYDNYEEMVYIGKKAIDAIKRRFGTAYQILSVYAFIEHRHMLRLKHMCPKKCGCTKCSKKISGGSQWKTSAVGSSTDWAKATFRTPIVATFELRPKAQKNSYRFLLPKAQIIPTSLETLDGVVTFLKEYDVLHPPQIDPVCVGYCYVINNWYQYTEKYPDTNPEC